MRKMIEMKDVVKLHLLGSEKIHALDGVSFDIEEGEMLAVVGPSGSGKTTMLELMGCVDYPTSGSIAVDGQEVSRLSERELTHLRGVKIGFIFQQFFLLPTLTAMENVELPALFAGNRGGSDRAMELLRLVGLENRKNHLPSHLSGGQMQRVAIARALVNNPKILLADEPTGNLDSKVTQDIFETLRGLNETGLTVVIVTHNLDIAKVCKRVIALKDGKIQL